MDDRVCGDIIKQVLPVYDSGMSTKTSQASFLMLLNTILMGVVVVVGAYTPRYRRHPVIGGLFMGATTLFLPIFSIIVTITHGVHGLIGALRNQVTCSDEGGHLLLVFLWTGVVVVIGINASAVVAGDAREDRNIDPPIILLVKGVWTGYLTFSTMGHDDGDGTILIQLFVIMFAKLVFKYAAFYKARRSFALGRNPRLMAGYMAQLQQLVVDDEHTDKAPTPPPLIVMGEDKVQVEPQPHGYNLKEKMPCSHQQAGDGDDTMKTTRAASSRLVTLDRVWGFKFGGDEVQRPKDLCFSFALFKLLRCRFAKYTVSEAGFIKTSKFFRKALIQDDDHYGRVFRIIMDELSFINDYYYSSLPIHYSHPLLLPALGVMLSLWSIGYSSFVVVLIVRAFIAGDGNYGQISCQATSTCHGADDLGSIDVGSLYYDAIPLCLVVAVLLLAEVREIVSYICSNWTKVALIYHHVNRDWWQRPRVVQKCIFALVKYRRCKLVNNWDDKMKQCSILVLRPRKTPLRRLRHLLRFVGGQKKVKVTNAVKAAIFKAIKEENFTTGHWLIPPPSSPIPDVYLYACNNGKHPAAYSILVWNIATSVFEASQLPQPPSESDHKTVATHLSRYCTYLVTSHPELLPDDAEWCRKLYDEVKKDADRVLGKVKGGEDLYDQLIQVLSADSSHEVLSNGAILGEKLVKDSAMGWDKLARFWVQMILYVAPSENLEAHAEAISRGGELITLLWAMLAHAGITGRLDGDGGVAAAEEGRGFAN